MGFHSVNVLLLYNSTYLSLISHYAICFVYIYQPEPCSALTTTYGGQIVPSRFRLLRREEKGLGIISTRALIVDLDFLLLWLLVFFFAFFCLCCLVTLLRTQSHQNHCSLSFLASFLFVNVRSCIYNLIYYSSPTSQPS